MWRQYLAKRERNVLALLYERYLTLVYGVCLNYLKDREEARDASMEIFEKLLSTQGGHDVDKFRTWLYVVAKNHCLMKLRSKKGQEEKKMQLFMEYGDYAHPLDEDEIDRSPQLHECLEGLKAEQKSCVALFYFEKKSYQQIAELERLDVKEVKSYIQNGKRNLKICIESKNE